MANDPNPAEGSRFDTATNTHTVGHEWDGIEELDTPMPRWWLWTFYATIAWSLVYVVLYPAWPLIDRATAGTLGWSSRGDLKSEMAAQDRARAPVMAAIASAPLDTILSDTKLRNAAQAGGAAAFKVHCVQCHGSGAAGSPGYPNLNDDDWLWGGDPDSIHYSITHGIRNPDHKETRMSAMPAFGDMLTGAEIGALTHYVRTLSGREKAGASSAKGAELFAANCAVCHGPDGKGMRSQGAPNLTDGIWLYGGDADTVATTIAKSRQGVMPRWNNRLDPVTIKMLTVYVHSRGGGEATPSSVAATTTPATPDVDAPAAR